MQDLGKKQHNWARFVAVSVSCGSAITALTAIAKPQMAKAVDLEASPASAQASDVLAPIRDTSASFKIPRGVKPGFSPKLNAPDAPMLAGLQPPDYQSNLEEPQIFQPSQLPESSRLQAASTLTAQDIYEAPTARAQDLAPLAQGTPETQDTVPASTPEDVPPEDVPETDEDTPESEEPKTEVEAEEEYVYGRRGQRRWFVQAGIGVPYDPAESNVFGLAGVGGTYFFANGHSINLVLNGLYFSQVGSDAAGINLNLIGRWHFLRQRNWSLFVDGGAGIIGTTSRVPLVGGSRFNFTPQVGGGLSFKLAKRRRLLVGLRWHHISNADLYEPNLGLDAVYGWVGLDLPW